MKTMEFYDGFLPLFTDGLARLRARRKADAGDVKRIFLPIFETICIILEPFGVSAADARTLITQRMETFCPDVDENSLRLLANDLVGLLPSESSATPQVTSEEARRKTEELLREMAAPMNDPQRPGVGTEVAL